MTMVPATKQHDQLSYISLSDMDSRLDHDSISGDIDHEFYIAARTYGDGACGLHALFGIAFDGCLYCPNVGDPISLCIQDKEKTCQFHVATFGMLFSNPMPCRMSD